MELHLSRLAAFCAAALLTPGLADGAEKIYSLSTSTLDFSSTLLCSATNVGSTPVDVTIDLLSPQSGTRLFNSTSVIATLQPGFGTANALALSVGYTSGYCKVTHTGSPGAVRAATCTKATLDSACQAVSEAR